MYNITFKEINKDDEGRLIDTFGTWVSDEISYTEGCYSLMAMNEDTVAGFISIYPRYYPEPLKEYCEAFISAIEVEERFRRHGIARKMLELVEDWASAYGYHQLGSWSSDDKTEAIPMWYALNYCVCPAWMRGYSRKKGFENMPINGFYVAKMLNPFKKQ